MHHFGSRTQRLSFFLLLSTALLSFVPLTHCSVSLKRSKIVQQGDFIIGALIPVHEQPTLTSKKGECGRIRDQYGVQRVEALLYMLDKINDKTKTNLLPGVKLGLEIRDECWETSIALEETIDFIKDTLSSDDEDLNRGVGSNSAQEKCQNRNMDNDNRIVAVIGPGGSGITINVQNLLQLFDIPQVGYSATSMELSEKKQFKTFLRVVPSDYLQVEAMIDLVTKMNWTYLFAVYTDGSYGEGGMETFRTEISMLNICLAVYEKIKEYAVDNVYEALILKMNAIPKARVIVCFCYGETIRGLLRAIHKLNLIGRFIIVGSDGWSDRIDVAKDFYEEAVGSFSIKAYSPLIKEFDHYFMNLNPSNNKRNVWFNEYWEETFKCYLNPSNKSKFTTPCVGKCPLGYRLIGQNCYHFSDSIKTWYDADEDCKQKNSKLVNILEKDELLNIYAYLVETGLLNEYAETHVKVKSFGEDQIINSKEIIDFNNNYAGANELERMMEERLKLKLCHLTKYYSHYNRHKTSANEEEPEVFTFFNSKALETGLGCILLNLTRSQRDGRISFCVNMDECNRRRPYICKLATKQIGKYYYKNDLKAYQQDPKMSYIMNAFLAVAHGLDRTQQYYCNDTGVCPTFKKMNGSVLLKNIKRSSFVGMANENIYFDEKGDPPGRYVILNVQKNVDKETNRTTYMYREVGDFNNKDKLTLNLHKLVFPNGAASVKSVCSEDCKFGHVKQTKQGEQKCCWTCKKCEDYAFVLDEFTCQECPLGYWPNANLTGCEKLLLVYLEWNEPATLFALLISFLGIIINTYVMHTFIKYSNTCVVKSTTRELSFSILIGAYFAYFMTVPLVMKPSTTTCIISRIIPGFSLSLMYGALVTKTHRISSILENRKKIITKKPRFLSITAQIVITSIIIAIECAFIIVGFVLEPDLMIVTYPVRNRAQLECYNSILTVLGPLGYNIFIVTLCTVYAVKTRNFPENFNEAKFIGFSMYTTCVIWIAFIPLYFGSGYKVVTLCLSTSFSATVLLLFLFFPKVYIIIFKPENNQRSAFVTSKDLRCHFGKNVQAKSPSLERNSSGPPLVKGFRSVQRSLKRVKTNDQFCQTSMCDVSKTDLNNNTNGHEETSLVNRENLRKASIDNLKKGDTLFLSNEDSACSLSLDGSASNSIRSAKRLMTDGKKAKSNADSLESFKNAFQSDKLTLNWRLLESSEYL